jgi:hypothetical protein
MTPLTRTPLIFFIITCIQLASARLFSMLVALAVLVFPLLALFTLFPITRLVSAPSLAPRSLRSIAALSL